MTHSVKEIKHLLESHSMKNNAIDTIFCDNIEGAGTKAAAKLLYVHMLTIALDAKKGRDQIWKVYPKSGLSKPKLVEEFMRKGGMDGLNCEYLLMYFSPSTYTKVFKMFFKQEFIFIDKFNRMWLKYPVNGQMMSLVNAAKSIKHSYKKEKVDITVSSDVSSVDKDEDDTNFWDKDSNKENK